MEFSTTTAGKEDTIVDLFTATFTASEGPDEGAAVGGLVARQLAEAVPGDIRVFTAWADGRPIGGAVFTRMTFARDPRTVFILSPVAVATDRQRQGVGQALLRHALGELTAAGVDIAVTYGDPAYYGKVGFAPVTIDTVPAPRPLSQPEGWIAQSLTGAALTPLQGPSSCVAALDDPALW